MLVIGTTGTETRFLSEAELPDCARLAYGADGPEEARPEEIADRELAEALQRSVQESGKNLSCLESVPHLSFVFFLIPALLELDVHVPLKASYSQPHYLNFHSHGHFMSSPQQFECAAEQEEIRKLRCFFDKQKHHFKNNNLG